MFWEGGNIPSPPDELCLDGIFSIFIMISDTDLPNSF